MRKKTIFYFGLCGFFLLRVWALEGFAIASTAMQPSLKIGDWIWINKLPFTEIQKNDIIAFRLPTQKKVRHVKRCLGIPGDKLLIVNGQYTPSEPLIVPQKGQTVVLNEQNFEFYEHIIQAFENKQAAIVGECIYINNEITYDFTFTQNYYYASCDNQLDASDCGLIPESNLIGKALYVW